MDGLNPRTFELSVAADGTAAPGLGVLVAVVPATHDTPPLVALACDPRHDPGRTIQALAPGAIGWLRGELGETVEAAVWVVIDNYGRFYRALLDFPTKIGAGGTAPRVVFADFSKGHDIDAFYADYGAPAEASIELLTALVEQPSQNPMTPPMAEFLDAIEAHGNLPAPGVIFHKVSAAAEEGDARKVASVIQPDPVISTLPVPDACRTEWANWQGFIASIH